MANYEEETLDFGIDIHENVQKCELSNISCDHFFGAFQKGIRDSGFWNVYFCGV